MESILTSIKKMLGIAEDDTNFDTDVIIHINSVLSVMAQLGVGPPEGVVIEDKIAEWSRVTQSNKKLELIKSYAYLKVKLVFDPPPSAAAVEAMNRMASELEWRIEFAST
jgi:hypothetical protein